MSRRTVCPGAARECRRPLPGLTDLGGRFFPPSENRSTDPPTDGGLRVPAEPAPGDDGVRSDLDRGSSKGTLRRGIVIVARGVRREKLMFGLAVGGAAVYGTGTAAGGWVLGRVTDRVHRAGLRGRADHHRAGRGRRRLAGAGRRHHRGGRRRPPGRGRHHDVPAPGPLPARRHPRSTCACRSPGTTGTPPGCCCPTRTPTSRRCGRSWPRCRCRSASSSCSSSPAAAMIVADPVLGGRRPARDPGDHRRQRRLPAADVADRDAGAQRLRGDVSAVAHESFEAATVVKTLGREAAETHRFEASAHRLRDANVAVGRLRGMFDPVVEALPTLGILLVLAVGTCRVSAGASTTADVVQVDLPAHDPGVPGARHRLGARRAAAHGRRLGADLRGARRRAAA